MAGKAKKTKQVPIRVVKAVRRQIGQLAPPDPIRLFRVRGSPPGGTGIAAFERTIQKTNIWIKEIMQEMGWADREKAYGALRACLHATRDLLTDEEVVQFGAQLPTLLRGAYFEGWRRHARPIRIKSVPEFHDLLFHHLGAAQKHFTDEEIEALTHAFFNVATKHISAGEMLHIRAGWPKKIQDLVPTVLEWPRRNQRAA